MDELVIHKWIHHVLKPYLETAPVGVEPVLILDSYKCHLKASVIGALEGLGVQVEHIPGGCTGLCQPVDVGIGKPLKNRVKNDFEHWMMEQDSDMTKLKAPTREVIAEWVVRAFEDIPGQMVKNSWRHHPFSYFQDEIYNVENVDYLHRMNDDDNDDEEPNLAELVTV